jgi:hypothetical protein
MVCDMHTLSVRVSDGEWRWLVGEASRRGVRVSALVRELVFGSSGGSDERLDDVERRLSRLEEMAGL